MPILDERTDRAITDANPVSAQDLHGIAEDPRARADHGRIVTTRQPSRTTRRAVAIGAGVAGALGLAALILALVIATPSDEPARPAPGQDTSSSARADAPPVDVVNASGITGAGGDVALPLLDRAGWKIREVRSVAAVVSTTEVLYAPGEEAAAAALAADLGIGPDRITPLDSPRPSRLVLYLGRDVVQRPVQPSPAPPTQTVPAPERPLAVLAPETPSAAPIALLTRPGLPADEIPSEVNGISGCAVYADRVHLLATTPSGGRVDLAWGPDDQIVWWTIGAPGAGGGCSPARKVAEREVIVLAPEVGPTVVPNGSSFPPDPVPVQAPDYLVGFTVDGYTQAEAGGVVVPVVDNHFVIATSSPVREVRVTGPGRSRTIEYR